MFCVICGTDRMVEQPPCTDGHAECPERLCVSCGAAIVAGWIADDDSHAA